MPVTKIGIMRFRLNRCAVSPPVCSVDYGLKAIQIMNNAQRCRAWAHTNFFLILFQSTP